MVVVPDQQVMAGVPSVLRASFAGQDGEPVTPDGPVEVSVRFDSDSSSLDGVADETADGWTFDLGARSPDLLSVTWTDTDTGHVSVTTVEVVGGHFASLAEIRSADPALVDPERYSDAMILGARRFVEEEFERRCERAFVPRYRCEQVRPGQISVVSMPDVREVLTVGVRIVDASAGIVAGAGGGEVRYRYGMNRPPVEVVRAFVMRLRNAVASVSSAVPDRASTFTSEAGGTYSLLTAGRGGSITALPEVDVVLREWSARVPGLA